MFHLFQRGRYLITDKSFQTYPYDIILIAGQSNAEGYGRGDRDFQFVPHDPIYGCTENRGIHLACDKKYGRRRTSASFCLYFGEEYVKAGLLNPGRKLMILNTAVGGTGFSDHHWGVGEDLFERMIRMAREVLALNPENEIKAFLWHQGETDVISGMSGTSYAGLLDTLISETQNRLNIAHVPFIAGNMVPGWMKLNPGAYEIAASTRKLMESLPLGGYAESDGLEGNSAEDIIHFSRKSCAELGRRYFQIYLDRAATHSKESF